MEQKPENPSTMEHLKGDQLILNYLVRPSSLAENPPVLILLHGVGSNEHDLYRRANAIPEQFLVIAARAPYQLGTDRFGWYEVDFSTGMPQINFEQAEKSRNVIRQFINQIVEKYQADAKKVYLAGFSQGAIMAYSAFLTYPEKLAGIAAWSGRLLEEVKEFAKPITALNQPQIFIAHGVKDEVLPIHYARAAHAYFQSMGLTASYQEYDMPHALTNEVFEDFLNWLSSVSTTSH